MNVGARWCALAVTLGFGACAHPKAARPSTSGGNNHPRTESAPGSASSVAGPLATSAPAPRPASEGSPQPAEPAPQAREPELEPEPAEPPLGAAPRNDPPTLVSLDVKGCKDVVDHDPASGVGVANFRSALAPLGYTETVASDDEALARICAPKHSCVASAGPWPVVTSDGNEIWVLGATADGSFVLLPHIATLIFGGIKCPEPAFPDLSLGENYDLITIETSYDPCETVLAAGAELPSSKGGPRVTSYDWWNTRTKARIATTTFAPDWNARIENDHGYQTWTYTRARCRVTLKSVTNPI